MKKALLITLGAILSGPLLHAATVELGPTDMGYYWYSRTSWSGGSNTSTGFAYGDASGLQHVQNNYQYYGGADRSWNQKNLFFQIDLSSVDPSFDGIATFHFYCTLINTYGASSSLYHLSTQLTAPTGDAGQQLAGDSVVASTTAFMPGWNMVDLTAAIQSDLAKGYTRSVFSIPMFGQVQDQNRLISLYGPTSTTLVEGAATVPYLELTVVPEPSVLGLALVASLAGWIPFRTRRPVP